jgi:hypothetical protein
VKSGGTYFLEDMSIPDHPACCIRNDNSFKVLKKYIETGEFDTDYILLEEKEYLKEIYEITDFINNDYFNEFKNNGTWPEFILDWNKLKSIEDEIYIDYFKYEHEKEKRFNRPAEKLPTFNLPSQFHALCSFHKGCGFSQHCIDHAPRRQQGSRPGSYRYGPLRVPHDRLCCDPP